jgi:transcriptional regulator with XRE-family HTH domain
VEDGSPGGPTAARILLGVRLRRIREKRGISRSKAAYAIRASDSKIGRMELGRSPFKERDVKDLLTLYAVTDERERESLLRLARESAGPGWWQAFGDLISPGYEHYLGLEQAAAQVRVYEPRLVPELLQTSHYARAITKLRHPREEALEVERRIDLQMERQRRFFEASGHRLWAVVDEAVLRRARGGSKVMRAQVGHLMEMGALRNVAIQVVPFTAVSSLGPEVGFTQFRFGEPDMPDVVHLDQATGAYYIDKPDDSEHFSKAMLLLAGAALPPGQSRALMDEVFEQI